MCELRRAIFGSIRGPIVSKMAEVGFCIFEAFSCNVLQSGVIIMIMSQLKMMDFYGVIFIFQGCGAGVGVQEAYKASF